MKGASLFLTKILEKTAETCLRAEGRLLLKKGRQDGFMEHVMAPDFDYKKHICRPNTFFKQWGFNFTMLEAAYYQQVNGIESELYIPYTLFTHYLIPFLNGDDKYIDKNILRKALGANNPNKKVEFTMPQQVVYNMRGIFYNANDDCISREEAVEAVMSYDKDIIVKPTLSTTWGTNVIKLKDSEKTEELVNQFFDKYRKDFSFEECVTQHPDMATLNESSLNTTRICTYRRPNGQVKFLFSIQRYGKPGAVIDNASAGGNFVGVFPDGTLNREVRKYKSLKTERLADNVTPRIPHFEKMKEAAIYLHTKLPDINYAGWDFSVTPDGVPVVIELNHRAAVEIAQIANGPAFTKEDLEELMPLVAKWKVDCKAKPLIRFDDERSFNAVIRK